MVRHKQCLLPARRTIDWPGAQTVFRRTQGRDCVNRAARARRVNIRDIRSRSYYGFTSIREVFVFTPRVEEDLSVQRIAQLAGHAVCIEGRSGLVRFPCFDEGRSVSCFTTARSCAGRQACGSRTRSSARCGIHQCTIVSSNCISILVTVERVWLCPGCAPHDADPTHNAEVVAYARLFLFFPQGRGGSVPHRVSVLRQVSP